MTGNNLFRLAAVKQQANRLEGDVIIAQPLSSTVLTASLVAIVGSLISFLALADFNRKETVTGYLQPTAGLAKVYAGRSGVISQIFVRDGSEVAAGAPLLLIQFPDQLAEGESLVQSLQASLQSQQQLIQQRRQQLELQGRQQLLLSAPVAGRVTNLIAEPGKTIAGQQPLLTILPSGTALEAVLLVPTRAFGFVQPGQRTRLRFEAFPYQRFGIYEGEITQTGQAILLPNELDMPVPIQEPVYRVAVALESQEIRAYGSSVPLQSGMLLSADIVLEQRSLLSWLLEPISSLRGRL